MPVDRIAFFSRDESPADLAPWREAIQNGRPVTGRLLGIEKDGDGDTTFCVSASPIVDDRGTSRGVLASFRDVTRLEQKKHELIKLVHYLRDSSEAIKQQNRKLDRDPHSIFQVANELLDLCRSTQQSLLDPHEVNNEAVASSKAENEID